jgi:membrane-associated phospholipid phosphatase
MIYHVRKSVRKIWARITLLSLELIVVLSAFFAALAAFVFVARMVFLKQKGELDATIFNYLAKYVSNVNTDVMQAFSFLGAHYFLIPANLLLVFYFLVIRKERWYSIKVPVISLSSLLLMLVLKQFFHRDRPLVPLLQAAKGLSFPSGHAMMSSTFYGLLIYLVWRNIKNATVKWVITILLLLVIFFIGLSRIYLRVHYPTDVMAGFCLGLIWLILSISILNKMERISKKEIDLVVEE